MTTPINEVATLDATAITCAPDSQAGTSTRASSVALQLGGAAALG
ncbi:MAG: hypothetical protein JWQ88_1189, partial [Rhodoferax sp.]|nr:hypothetical protein [Rhodoferax sp.]